MKERGKTTQVWIQPCRLLCNLSKLFNLCASVSLSEKEGQYEYRSAGKMKYTCCKCLSVSWRLTDSVTCTRGLLRNLTVIKLMSRSPAEASKAPCRRTHISGTQEGETVLSGYWWSQTLASYLRDRWDLQNWWNLLGPEILDPLANPLLKNLFLFTCNKWFMFPHTFHKYLLHLTNVKSW